MLPTCRRAIPCIAFTLLLASSAAAQAASEHLDELASSTECRMLIQLGNDGLYRHHGVLDYSRSGDVWLHCQGRSVRLTRTGDVFSFALFPDGSRLAVVRHLHRDPSSNAPALLEEIDLETGQVFRKEQLPARLYKYEVVRTCGTVLLLGYHMRKIAPGQKVHPPLETDVTDLLTGKQTANANFNSIRCTADRSVVLRKIGPPWVTLGSLFIGATGDNTLARDKVGDFGLSPNGKYVAFTTGSSVCILDLSMRGAAPTCVDRFWDRDRLDVSDNGEVWLTGDSLTNCPGKENIGLPTFTCDAIFSWNASESAPRLVVFGYVDPYGVSLELGQRITALANNWQQK
jgi:hypothetical protein